MSIIIDHTYKEYKERREKIGNDRYNGAYYYSKEIVENIIPYVKTDRNWITIKAGELGADHSICFVHNNVNFETAYAYMRAYKDVIYVVGLPDMVQRASDFGKTIYLPLSIDVKYVQQFKTDKIKDRAFVGRRATRRTWHFPDDTDFIEGLPRDELLSRMAQYRRVFAIGRTAIEAKALDCDILPFHPRLPDPELWQVLDNRDASKILQKELDKIDV